MFVGIIWRPTPDRHYAFQRVNEFWNQYAAPRYFDASGDHFQRAASRNLTVRMAEKAGAEKLVIADADCIPEPNALLQAWDQVDDTAIHLPYTTCITHNADGDPVAEIPFTCGGIYITTVKAWWSIGGQDERFVKWAPEDMAFSLAHETILGRPLVKHPGKLLSLGHQADQNRHTDSEDDDHVQLFRRYEKARGDRTAMEALCFQWS